MLWFIFVAAGNDWHLYDWCVASPASRNCPDRPDYSARDWTHQRGLIRAEDYPRAPAGAPTASANSTLASRRNLADSSGGVGLI